MTIESGISNKVVFVTGGANGIGRAIVIAFCEAGADVVFCDIDEAQAMHLCNMMSDYPCSFIKADVSDIQSLNKALQSVFEEKGDIDIIINNAGIGSFKSLLDITVEEFDKTIAANLRSVFLSSQAIAKHRAKNGNDKYGRIINIASTRYLMSEPNSEAYAASKGGIVSLTHALAITLAKYKITVNCISPGWIDTGNFGEIRPIDHAQHPSGRVGIPDDITRACLFLCYPNNDFINGQNIVIDGGMTKKMIYEE